MVKFGEIAATEGGRWLGVSPVLQGSGTGGPSVWSVFMVTVRHYDEVSGGHPCGVHTSDHG